MLYEVMHHIDFEKTKSYAFGKDAIGEDLGREAMRVAGQIKTSPSGKRNNFV